MNREIERQTDRCMNRETDIKTYRQIDRQM